MFDICTRRRTHVIAIAFGVIFLVGECFSNLALSIEYSAAPSPGSRVLKSITPLECQPNCSCSDVWIVSTRGLPGICEFPDRANFTVERLRECGRWEKSNLPSLLENPNQPIHIFVHGNRYESGDAKSQGAFFARQMTAACPESSSVRTVIFSWPSAQQGILLKDGRAKYNRCFSDGHYLAHLLGFMEPQRPVALMGYSFGALIILEGLSELVELEQNEALRPSMQPWTHRSARTHMVLVAAAVRCDAFSPRGPYRGALQCVDRLVLINNSRDDALKHFPKLDPCMRIEAMGYAGMRDAWFLPSSLEYTATDASNIIGRHHGLPLYLSSPSLTRRIASGALEGLDVVKVLP